MSTQANIQAGQGNLGAADDALVVVVANFTNCAIQIEGMFSATVAFEATSDNATWESISLTPSGGGSAVTSTTGTGLWQGACGGYYAVRARVSSYTSGTVETVINAAGSMVHAAGGDGLATWDARTTYTPGALVTDRGGIWQAVDASTNSRPTTTNAHWTFIGGNVTSPQTVGGLALWLDAAQIVGLSNGDPVATWADESGNSYDAVQATTVNKPAYETNVQNGKPGVLFDPSVTPRWLNSPTGVGLLKNVPGATVLVAFKSLSQSTNLTLFSATNNAGDKIRAMLSQGTETMLAWIFQAAFSDASDASSGGTQWSNELQLPAVTAPAVGASAVLCGVVDNIGSNISLEGSTVIGISTVNNISIFSEAPSNFANTNSAAMLIGALLNDGTAPMNGYLFEMLVYPRALSAPERNTLLAYLSTKWGTL